MSEQSQSTSSKRQQQLASSGVALSSVQPLEIRHFEQPSESSRRQTHSSQCKRNRFNRLSKLSCSGATEADTVETASHTGDSETSSDKQENQLTKKFNKLTKTRLKSLPHLPGFAGRSSKTVSLTKADDARTEVSDDTVETNSVGKESTDCSSSQHCGVEPDVRTFTAEQGGLSLPLLKSKLRMSDSQRQHLRSRIADLEQGVATDSKDTVSISGGNTSCQVGDEQFVDFTLEVAVYTESPPADRTLSDENEDIQTTLTAKPGGEGEMTESTDQQQKITDDPIRLSGGESKQSGEQSLSLTDAATGGSSSKELSEQSHEQQQSSKAAEDDIDESKSHTRDGQQRRSTTRSSAFTNETNEPGEVQRKSREDRRKNSTIEPMPARRLSKGSSFGRSSKQTKSEADEVEFETPPKSSRESQKLVERFSRLSQNVQEGLGSKDREEYEDVKKRASTESQRSSRKSGHIEAEIELKRKSSKKETFESSAIQPKRSSVKSDEKSAPSETSKVQGRHSQKKSIAESEYDPDQPSRELSIESDRDSKKQLENNDEKSEIQASEKTQGRSSKLSENVIQDELDVEKTEGAERSSRKSLKDSEEAPRKSSRKSRRSVSRESKRSNDDNEDGGGGEEEPRRPSRESIKEAALKVKSSTGQGSKDCGNVLASTDQSASSSDSLSGSAVRFDNRPVSQQSDIQLPSVECYETEKSHQKVSKSSESKVRTASDRSSADKLNHRTEETVTTDDQLNSSSSVIVEAEIQAKCADGNQLELSNIQDGETTGPKGAESDTSATENLSKILSTNRDSKKVDVDSKQALKEVEQSDSMHLICDRKTDTTEESSYVSENTPTAKTDAQLGSEKRASNSNEEPSNVQECSTKPQLGSPQSDAHTFAEDEVTQKCLEGKSMAQSEQQLESEEVDNTEDTAEGQDEEGRDTEEGSNESLLETKVTDSTEKEALEAATTSDSKDEKDGVRSSKKSFEDDDQLNSKDQYSLGEHMQRASVADFSQAPEAPNRESLVDWPDSSQENMMSRPSFVDLDGPSSSRIFSEMDAKEIRALQDDNDAQEDAEPEEEENNDTDASCDSKEKSHTESDSPEKGDSDAQEEPQDNYLTKQSFIAVDGPSVSVADSEPTDEEVDTLLKVKRSSQRNSGQSSRSDTDAVLGNKMHQIDAQLASQREDNMETETENSKIRASTCSTKEVLDATRDAKERGSFMGADRNSKDSDYIKEVSKEAEKRRASERSEKEEQESKNVVGAPLSTSLINGTEESDGALNMTIDRPSVITADGPSISLAGSEIEAYVAEENGQSERISSDGVDVARARTSKTSAGQEYNKRSSNDREADQDGPDGLSETCNGVVYMCESTTSEAVSRKDLPQQPPAPEQEPTSTEDDQESADDKEADDSQRDDLNEESTSTLNVQRPEENEQLSEEKTDHELDKASQQSEKGSSGGVEDDESPEMDENKESINEEEERVKKLDDESEQPLAMPKRLEPSIGQGVAQQIGAISSSEATVQAGSEPASQDPESSELRAEVELPSKESVEKLAAEGHRSSATRSSVASSPQIGQTGEQRQSDIRLPSLVASASGEVRGVNADCKSDVDNKVKQQSSFVSDKTQRDQRVESLICRFREAAQECANVRLDREALRRELEATRFELRMATAEAQERRTELTWARREVEIRDERLRQQAAVQVRTEKEVGNLRSQLAELRRQLDSAENSCQAELARNQRYRAQLVSLEAQLDSRIHELTAVTNALIEKRRSEEDLLARVQHLQRSLSSSEETVTRLTGQLATEQKRAREILLTERSLLQQQQQQLARCRRYSSLNSPSQLTPQETNENPAKTRSEAPQQTQLQQQPGAPKSELVSRLEQRIAQMDARIERLIAEARDRMSRHQQQRHVQHRRSNRHSGQQEQQQQEQEQQPDQHPESSKRAADSKHRTSQTVKQQHLQHQQPQQNFEAQCDEGALSSLEHRAAQLESSNRQLVQDVQSLRCLCSGLLLQWKEGQRNPDGSVDTQQPQQLALTNYLQETEKLRRLIDRQMRDMLLLAPQQASPVSNSDSSQLAEDLRIQQEAVNQSWQMVQQTFNQSTADPTNLNDGSGVVGQTEPVANSSALLRTRTVAGCGSRRRQNEEPKRAATVQSRRSNHQK